MIIYISGAMTGIPDLNRAAFEQAEAKMLSMGHVVFNPHNNGMPVDAKWSRHMRADIRALMDCDAILMLPGWELSRGARLENHIADALGMAIMFLP